MRPKLVLAVTAALCVSLLGATGASAATEAGSRCPATSSNGPFMFVSLATPPASGLPAAIPSSGVITRWSFAIGLPIPPETLLFETLKVFRPTGVPLQLQVVGESPAERILGGAQTFPTRIPVKAGDLIGALATVPPQSGTVFCETANPGDRVGVINGTAPAGSTATITEEKVGFQNPVVVSVEPDADNDGFGDETQDGCPQSAAFQTPCPPVTLAVSKQVRKGSVTIIVTSNTGAPVTVKGVAKLGKGKKAKLSGGTKNLVPGAIGRFTLRFTKALKTKLKELTPKQTLQLKVTVSGASVSGAVTTSALKIKLKGQAKPSKR